MHDYNIGEYSKQVLSFVTKRWTTKREVPPKVAIMDDMGPEYGPVYYTQRLAHGEHVYEKRRLERMYQNDTVNAQFLHSVFCEPYEKPLIEYAMQKRIMNGSVVPMGEKVKHDAINDKLRHWFSTFYKGDALSNYEVDLERQYVNDKYRKNMNYQKRRSSRYRVKFTVSDLNRY